MESYGILMYTLEEKFKWLIENNPWVYNKGGNVKLQRPAAIALSFCPDTKKPCVFVIYDYWDGGFPSDEPDIYNKDYGMSFVIYGDTYEQAIDNAIEEAKKQLTTNKNLL